MEKNYRKLREDFRIENIIIHRLDNKNKETIYSPLEVKTTPSFSKLIFEYINASLLAEKSRVANFKEYSGVKDIFEKILNGSDFIINSKNLGEKLYSKMEEKPQISPSNFVVCKINSNGRKMVAVLKLNFESLFYTEIIETENGEKTIEVVEKTESLPSKNTKLQKCAFYWEKEEERDFDLILLDKQQTQKSKEKDVADFFINYLECVIIENNQDWTKKIIKETRDVLNLKSMDEKIPVFIEKIKTSEEISIHKLADMLFDQEEEQIEYKEKMLRLIPNETFSLDKEYTEQCFKKRHYIGKYDDVSIVVPESLVEDKEKMDVRYEQGKITEIIFKNIDFEIK